MKHATADTFTCLNCGAQFARSKEVSGRNWRCKLTCSEECAQARVHEQSRRREAARQRREKAEREAPHVYDRRHEWGRYRQPGSVTCRDLDFEKVAALWVKVFGVNRPPDVTAHVCDKATARRCARCKAAWCGLCRERVHPVCSLKEKAA